MTLTRLSRKERGQGLGRVRVEAGVSTSWLAAAAASFFLLAHTAAHAADDRFDRTKYDGRGGFAPISNDSYRKECGACHFAYLPGLLPARSWQRVMDSLANHFGETIDLADTQTAELRQYLISNAADKVPDKGPSVLLDRLDADKTPDRITRVPHIQRWHAIVREVMKNNALSRAHAITNCDTCHQKAGEGSFALRDLVVPGVTKVIRPGSQF
jgi:hypothetical protein